MIVKIVRHETAESPRREELYPCADVTKTIIRPESVTARAGSTVGVIVDLGSTQPGASARRLHIPTDCDIIYVMNDDGSTIDRIYYNPNANVAPNGARQ